MGHIERHIQKSDNDLATRMLKEWKNGIGVLYDGAILEIKNVLDNMAFDFNEKDVIILDFDKYMGYGYNRLFQKVISKQVKVVLIGNNKEYEIITAYPNLEVGVVTNEYFDFFAIASNYKDKELFDMFMQIYSNHKYEVRFVESKNSYIKLSAKDCIVKIKKGRIIVTDNYKIEKSYNYDNINFVLSVLDTANSFVHKTSFFGERTIFHELDKLGV